MCADEDPFYGISADSLKSHQPIGLRDFLFHETLFIYAIRPQNERRRGDWRLMTSSNSEKSFARDKEER